MPASATSTLSCLVLKVDGLVSSALSAHVGPMFVQPALECIDRWRHHNVLRKPVPVCDYSVAERIFLDTPILYTQRCVKCNRFIIWYTERCANAMTNILYTQRRQMATLDAPKVLLLSNKTKLTLTVALTLTLSLIHI